MTRTKEAISLSPFIYTLNLVANSTSEEEVGGFDKYIIVLVLVINPFPAIDSVNINVTDPWPEFYLDNYKSYKYRLAEPTVH